MTKDSPSAASLALRSKCSAFSRCISRVSDIAFQSPSFLSNKLPESSGLSHNSWEPTLCRKEGRFIFNRDQYASKLCLAQVARRNYDRHSQIVSSR